jgi:hypothetical protein
MSDSAILQNAAAFLDALASPPEQAGAQAAVLAAASQWWCEREITDWDEAALAKAVIELDGDWEGCPDCDHATCDMPCTPATVSEQIRAVDRHIAQLVHDGKLHAGADYKAPDGWLPMLMPRKRAAPSPSAPLDQQRGQGEREAFEADWRKRHKLPMNNRRHDDGSYGDGWVAAEWAGWQAHAAQPPQAPPAAPVGWRVIETAPKGVKVLLRSPSETWVDDWDRYDRHNAPGITHWMPIPAAPAAPETGATSAERDQ